MYSDDRQERQSAESCVGSSRCFNHTPMGSGKREQRRLTGEFEHFAKSGFIL